MTDTFQVMLSSENWNKNNIPYNSCTNNAQNEYKYLAIIGRGRAIYRNLSVAS